MAAASITTPYAQACARGLFGLSRRCGVGSPARAFSPLSVKARTRRKSSLDWPVSSTAAEEDSSEEAAFCCVTPPG